MSLYRPPVQSQLPLEPVWRALGRHHVGVLHHMHADGWYFAVERLVKRGNDWYKVPVVEITEGANDLAPIVEALPHLPGIGVRLALMAVLLGID